MQAAQDSPAFRSVLREQGDGSCRLLALLVCPWWNGSQRSGVSGQESDPWQLDVLEGGHARLLLNGCRPAGKSTVVAMLALAQTVWTLATRVLLVSRSQRQSEELFRIMTGKEKSGRASFSGPLRPAALAERMLQPQMGCGRLPPCLTAERLVLRRRPAHRCQLRRRCRPFGSLGGTTAATEMDRLDEWMVRVKGGRLRGGGQADDDRGGRGRFRAGFIDVDERLVHDRRSLFFDALSFLG